ncbi:uncharacterized protein ACNS7B_014392 [Menidia menidia]
MPNVCPRADHIVHNSIHLTLKCLQTEHINMFNLAPYGCISQKDMQIWNARRDSLWREVITLQKERDDLESQQGALQLQMNLVMHSVKFLTELKSRGWTQLDISTMEESS